MLWVGGWGRGSRWKARPVAVVRLRRGRQRGEGVSSQHACSDGRWSANRHRRSGQNLRLVTAALPDSMHACIAVSAHRVKEAPHVGGVAAHAGNNDGS